jgi:hypothetical protein
MNPNFNDVVSVFRNNTDNDKIMYLNIYVDDTNDLKQMYRDACQKHNNSLFEDPYFFNAGFDLLLTKDQEFFKNFIVNKVDFKIKCSAKIYNIRDDNLSNYYTGYYVHPRSSLSKSPLRLANSTGIIDAGYRGPLIGMFDCFHEKYDTIIFTRLLQICAPSLMPIYVNIVDDIAELGPETSRGEGGFGSTNAHIS